MSAHYTFRDVLHYADIPPNRLKRWLQPGVITPAASEEGRRNRFSFRNLVEARVCDDLRIGGVNEPGLRVVVETLNTVWDQPDDPIGDAGSPACGEATILWCAFQRTEIGGGIAIYPVDPTALVSRLTTGDADG